MRGWILESPTATSQFGAFFERGGFIDQRPDVGLPYYAPGDPPRIVVDRSDWNSMLSPDASTWPQRHMFGTLAHEIGHDRFNTGSVVFAGRTADEYVGYRAGLEANAVFNAFPIFKELEAVAEFKSGKPFGSIGYLNEVELGMLYGDWKAGRLNDASAVERIAAKVADAPYTLSNPPADINRDGVVTHRDAYLRDYAKYIEPKLQQPSAHGQADPRDAERPDNGLLEHLRQQVRALDRQAGKDWDEGSERLSASALAMAKENGYTLADDPQLAFNQPNGRLAAGEVLHLFRQGPNASPDPYANRVHMQTAEALSMPAEERYRQAEATSATRDEPARGAQQEPTRGSNGSDKSGPGFAM